MNHSHDDNLLHFGQVVAKENDIWLAVEDGTTVGFLAIRGETIDQLYVEPGRQRSGVGSALVARAKEISPTRLTLFTHQRNERAREFYERRGFRAMEYGVSPAPESEPDVRYEWIPEGGK